MRYKILFEKNAYKQLEQIDHTQRKIIINWIDNNLKNSENPRLHGKSMRGNLKDYWRYRVGDYRIVVDIKDSEIVIVIIQVGHRKDIYRKF